MEEKQVVLSGMRPSGKLHIGHLEGVLREWVTLQEENQCNFFVADYHAITTESDTRALKEDTFDMVKDWAAFGINPEESNIFVQSQVPEHAELHLVLSMLVNLGRLERLPTFVEYLKEVVKVNDKDVKKYDEAKRAKVNYGFLGYPILQTSDILLYKTDIVPVGSDQLPHIELTQEIAKRFNGIYGNIFQIPYGKLGSSPRILGTDGRKMSKSYNNVISPMDDLETLTKKIKKMVTDTNRGSVKNPGNPYECSVFDLQEIYDKEYSEEISSKCKKAKLSCKDCKEILPKKIFDTYKEFRDKRVSIDNDYIEEILIEGTKKTKEIASQTMNEVREVMLMDYFGGK